MTPSDPGQGTLGSDREHRGLTVAEDHELRQLTWFSLAGRLSDSSQARLDELVARDRRIKVRDPRPDPGASEAEEAMKSAARLSPGLDSGPASFRCPNCGFVQRDSGNLPLPGRDSTSPG